MITEEVLKSFIKVLLSSIIELIKNNTARKDIIGIIEESIYIIQYANQMELEKIMKQDNDDNMDKEFKKLISFLE